MNTGRPLVVEDVLLLPALEMTLLGGAAGIGRRVAWAHVSELTDPTPWLLGSELLMTTGMAIPVDADGQVAYVERLADNGVAGLAVSAHLHVPPLSPAFFAAVERRSLPVLEVPLQVPFIAIAQAVAAAVEGDMSEGLSAQLQVFGAVRWLTAEGLGVQEIFARLESLSGFSLYLCSADGQPLLAEVPAPPPELRILIPSRPDSAPAIPNGYVLRVPTPSGPAGFLVAQRRAESPAGLPVVQHIATVAALQLTIVRHEQETVRREGAETLAEMLGGGFEGPPVRRRLARLGFSLDRVLTLAVIRGFAGSDVGASVTARLSLTADPHLVLRQEQQILALLPDDLARKSLGGLDQASVGLSRSFEAGASLEIPRREALWAVTRAEVAGGGLMRYGGDAAGRWLADEAAALRALTSDVLGVVLDYDRTHRSALVPSVRTWMERERHAETAAHALGIHPNTLAYRLKRFEQLSGRDLASTADLAEVWLALRASEHVTEDPGHA